ncbi:MAG: SIR2 family protein [Alphaproteobacteria bacterium]|nr:SIR2 family protein [Alphaproteobacteria bacterium]
MSQNILTTLASEIAQGRRIPYLGPELVGLQPGGAVVPDSTPSLAKALSAKVAVPGRLRGNVWSSAQYIETNRHRQTLDKALQAIFAPVLEPLPLHRKLAAIDALPLIVDAWYDGALPAAMAGHAGRGMVQGVTKADQVHDVWNRWYRMEGQETDAEEGASWTQLLYKPHGSVVPKLNLLISDADYVQVLAEIDIQTPIPAEVQKRRTGRPFLFLGCRFHDQIERNFARQIIKRSAEGHMAVIAGELTRNEARFLDEQGVSRLDMPLAEAVDTLDLALSKLKLG